MQEAFGIGIGLCAGAMVMGVVLTVVLAIFRGFAQRNRIKKIGDAWLGAVDAHHPE